MICLRLSEASMTPPSGALLGTSGSQQILNQINSQWANAGVIFGQTSDPRTNRYAAFMNTIVEPANIAAKMIENISHIIFNPNHIHAVTSIEDLDTVPPALQIPLLTCPEIRNYFDKGQLYGWGIDPASLPSEDIAGRLINNGTAFINHPNPEMNSQVWEWTWKSDDPKYTEDYLDAIRDSRQWFAKYINEQMQAEAEHLDPTNHLSPMPGRLKK